MSAFTIQLLVTGGVTLGIAIIFLVLSLKLSSAQEGRESYRVMATQSAADLKASDLVIASLTSDLKTANSRVEALDAENQKLRAQQPVAGAYDRLLSSAAPQTASGGASGGVVPDGKPAAPSGSDELLDPAKA